MKNSVSRADAGHIQRWLEHINTFNSTPEFGTTRVLFTEPELSARRYVKGEMEALGIEVHEDAIGNIFGVYPGTDRNTAPVWTGSHIDTVLNAGMFDGMSGVVAGLEAVRLIKEADIQLKRSLVVVVYTSEEPTRFRLGCLGSRALAGRLDRADAAMLRDEEDNSLYDVLKQLNFPVKEFDKLPKKTGEVFAAVELHIDQTGVLERAGKTVGIVKTICAPSVLEVEVIGRQSHAGGTSMEERRDAFMAACEISLAAEKLGQESTSEYTTVTVGKIQVVPNAVNVIPGKVIFSIDIRDSDYESKNQLVAKFSREVAVIELQRGITVNIREVNNDVPMPCDKDIQDIVADSCERLQVPYMHTISGAFHDSMLVGEFAPVAMIFVPSHGGISHSPQEWTDFAEIAAGVDVLVETLIALTRV